MPNYTVQTQYILILQAKMYANQKKIITTDRKKEEKRREEKRREERRREAKYKRRETRKNRLRKERAHILQTFYEKNMFKNTLIFKIV